MGNNQFICGTPDEKHPEVVEFKRREEAHISKTGMHVFILPRSDELDAVHTNRTNAIIMHNCGGTLNALLLPSHSIANVTKITVFDDRMFVETTTSLRVITDKNPN